MKFISLILVTSLTVSSAFAQNSGNKAATTESTKSVVKKIMALQSEIDVLENQILEAKMDLEQNRGKKKAYLVFSAMSGTLTAAGVAGTVANAKDARISVVARGDVGRSLLMTAVLAAGTTYLVNRGREKSYEIEVDEKQLDALEKKVKRIKVKLAAKLAEVNQQ